MCVICAKPIGVKPPTKAKLEAMFNKNPDGAGYMYADGNKVHIVKGFMSFSKFYKNIEKLYKTINPTETSIVYHFRITTSGGSIPQNCHPFPVSDSLKDLQKTNFNTDLGVAHNGVINITPMPETSDIMTFITRELSKLYKSVPNFLRDKNLLEMIESRIESKLCFLEPNGRITTIGDFILDDDATLVSNRYYLNTSKFYTYDYVYDNVTDYKVVPLAPVYIEEMDEKTVKTLYDMMYDVYNNFMTDNEGKIYVYSEYYNDAESTGLVDTTIDLSDKYFEPCNVL